jgi:arylformamidase
MNDDRSERRAAHPHYTTEFCEREYNSRAAIPEHPQIFARWAEQAAATRRLRACVIDLPYGTTAGTSAGSTASERLDLFPAARDGAPLLVFIHGGYWRALDKSDFSWIAPPFVQQGVSVAVLNHGLAPQTPLEEIVRQVLRAAAWLYRNAERLGFDAARMYFSGHSAGAHLTAMLMAALWPAYADDLPADLVKGGLAISGVFDLEPLVHAPFLNVDLQLDGPRARRLSPVYLPPATLAPLVTAVGALESSEFKRQNALMGQRWRANLARDLTLPGCNHLTACDELARPGSALFEAALEMLRR